MSSLNRPAGLGKRLLGALIDFFVVFALTVLINSYISTPIAVKHFDLEVKETICADYQEEYYKIAKKYGIGTYERDGNEFTFTYADLEDEEINSLVETFENDDEVVLLTTNYLAPALQELNNMYFVIISSSLLIPMLIIFMIIPLLIKRSPTLGQLILGLGTVHKADIDARKFQIILRFISLFVIEILLVFYFFSYYALFISPIIGFVIMALNQNRNTLHDILSSTKVVTKDALIFKDFNEKNDYLSLKEKQKHVKKVYDADTQELRNNFKFIDEQEERLNETDE